MGYTKPTYFSVLIAILGILMILHSPSPDRFRECLGLSTAGTIFIRPTTKLIKKTAGGVN